MSDAGRGPVLRAPFRARRAPLALGELVDVELQWQRDRGADGRQLAQRDARIGRELAADAVPGPTRADGSWDGSPEQALRAWLGLVYAGRTRPGGMVERWLRTGTALLGVGGAVLGALATAGLLLVGGTANVAHLLGVLVGLQLVVLVFLLAHLPSWSGETAQGGLLAWALEKLLGAAQRRTGRDAPAGERPAPVGATPHFSGDLATPMATPALWRLVVATQTFGVFFNLGALVTLLALVSFTDLAFSWSTTLDVAPASVARLTDAISFPWAWLWPAARPSPAVLEATRLYRLAPARIDPLLARAWWPFVTAALAVYGLLPRLVMLAVARVGTRRTLRLATFASADAAQFARRLDAAEAPGKAAPTVPLPADVSTCAVIVWRDVPGEDATFASVAAAATGLKASWTARAGGLAGDLDGGRAGAQLAAQPAGALAVVVDEFETYDKGLQRFVAGIRKAAPALPVLLVPVRAPDSPSASPSLVPSSAVGSAGRATAEEGTRNGSAEEAGTEPTTDARRLAAWRSALAKAGDRHTLLAASVERAP